MRLYETIIDQWEKLLSDFPVTLLPVERPGWRDSGSRNMVLRSDMAYELGGEGLPALGGTAVTEAQEGLCRDEIWLCGRDLPELTGDTPYARLTVAAVEKGLPEGGSALYQAIKRIEFVRFHVNPEGFMSRISTLRDRESARVSRQALKEGLCFSQVGSRMLESYHENPRIQAARLIYITDPRFPFDRLAETLKESRQITKAIDHAMTQSMTDCNVCSLKKVCDEVEGIRELHFGAKKAQEP